MELSRKPIFLITNPKYLRIINTEHAENYEKDTQTYKFFDKLIGRNSVFGTNDLKLWKRNRTLFLPLFNLNNLANYCCVFQENISNILEEFPKNKPSEINLIFFSTRITLLNLIKTLYQGAYVDILEFNQTLQQLTVFSFKQRLSPFFRLKLHLPTKARAEYVENQKKSDSIVNGIVQQIQGNKLKPYGLLTLLFDEYMKQIENKENQQIIHDEVLSFLSAGHETTASILSRCLIEICLRPEIKIKIINEINEKIKDRQLTFESMLSLTYITAFIEECLRLHPPVPVLIRRAIQNDQLGDHQIPAGSKIIIPTYYINRDPKYWPEPNMFYPERHFVRAKGLIPENNMTFNPGKRVCMGKNFAIYEIIISLVFILSNFELSLPPDAKTKDYLDITLHPSRDLRIKLSPKDLNRPSAPELAP